MPALPIGWDYPFVASLSGRTFSNYTRHAHDVVLVQVSCTDTAPPALNITPTTPGWIITSGLKGGMPGYWATVFALISPDTNPGSFSVTGCTAQPDAIGDAFSNVDTGSPIDVPNVQAGSGPCTASLTTTSSGDAIWCACMYSGTSLFADAGWIPGSSINHHLSEALLTTDPAGHIETAAFQGGATTGFVITEVALKPQ